MSDVRILPCLDDSRRAAARRRELHIPRERAFALAHETLAIVKAGGYRTAGGRAISIVQATQSACRSKVSLAPDASLPTATEGRFSEMRIQVANETTAVAGRRLLDGCRTIALNFANGFVPGGGFVSGACAQEESLCRASALFETLRGDAMYDIHVRAGDPASSDHAILSPDVPFFRDADWTLLGDPYLLSVLTCAAPMAFEVGAARAADLLRGRIRRVLEIMAAYRYDAVVLGAWGCGAFGNDPRTTAVDFRDALLGPLRGAFREVVFAVADSSPERRTLGPFRDAFHR